MAEFEPTEPAWIIWFEEDGIRPMVFVGEDAETAALRVYRAKANWNCSLFKQVNQNWRPTVAE